MSPCIQLHSGRVFDFENPTPEMVRVQDIAYALAGLARFTGHARRSHQGFPYTVAQHSVLVSRLVDPQYALEGLLHDAHEAYVQDLNSPCKKMVPEYKDFESRIEEVVRCAFRLPRLQTQAVKEADLDALWQEVQRLMPDHKAPLWDWIRGRRRPMLVGDPSKADEWLEPWPHNVAHGRFIERYRELTE